MKGLSKRLLGILLAASMVVTMSPLQGAAAENEGTEAASVVKTEASENKQSAANTTGVTQDDGEKTPTYDINQPVIESFEFAENGQSLTTDSTLHFTMSAYDSDSGIRYIDVQLSSMDHGYIDSVRLEKGEEENVYCGEISCSRLRGNECYVSHIRVEDMVGNYVDWETWDNETQQYRYTFTLDGNIDASISVSNFRMQTNASNEDGKLRPGDTVTYTVDVICDKEKIRYCYASLGAYENSSSNSQSVNLSYDEAAQILAGTFTVTDKTYPTEWNLSYIYVSTESGKSYYFYPSSIEPEADLKFEVVQEDFDTEPPVIESITVDKNGQFVKSGEVVNLTVKVSEEHPGYAYAYFYPQVTNVSVSQHVSLEYDAATSSYTGSITITEDTYPCEWALRELYIYDENNNRTYLSDFRQDYNELLPWYYMVESKNTYREDYKKVTFNFYGFAEQEDGSYQADSLISSKTAANVGRRVTLRELDVAFPQSVEGVTAKWRYGSPWWGDELHSSEIDENTKLLFRGTSDITYDLTASYDKVCANVSLTYMSKDNGIKEVMIPQFVDKGTTYREVLDALELPEDADVGQLAGVELSYTDDYYNDSTQIEEKTCRISAEAKYKDCQVAWNARYMGQDGKETSRVINKSYLEGTGLSDALAELEPPEDIDGMEFESWILVGDSPSEISQPMASMDVVAVYQGKTTVDAAYTYRGEDGEITSGRGMVLMDGVDLSKAEIEGAATEAFKGVNHLKGLRLSEWKGAIEGNQPRYKTVRFQACYQNCVLILNNPDGTSQYVVLDKHTQYTLPTEYEKYIDIVWKGCEKGETVTVMEDREFFVDDFKFQDETKEGIKLSQEEIDKIIEEIEDAQPGATIKVDMQKATVVPKEVLEAIKGKSVEIFLDMGEYSWKIGGTDVLATKLRDIDLEVKIDTNVIPPNLISSLAGDRPATQLSLTHNGDFGFRADLTVNLDSKNSGGTGNLYYYDSSGKLIFMNSGKIGADGNTSLSFSHASDYVVVVDKVNSSDDKKEDETDKDEDNLKKNIEIVKDANPRKDVGIDKDIDKQKKDVDKQKKNSSNLQLGIGSGRFPEIRKTNGNLTTAPGGIKTDASYRKSPKTGE